MSQKLAYEIDACLCEIEKFDFSQLDVNQYNKEYIALLKLALPYHFSIYKSCFKMLMKAGVLPESATLVDYGGGIGFVSIIAHKLGFKDIIYCDCNPDSARTFEALCEKLYINGIKMVIGSSKELQEYCYNRKIVPDCLLSTDVIEHIYDLNVFFEDMAAINLRMEMVFTTASNPMNKRKCRSLRKVMQVDELDFYNKRLQFIKEKAPFFNIEKQLLLATNSRGLHYNDILQCIEKNTIPNLLQDKYNTCDPKTGSWTERILSINEYTQIVQKNGFRILTSKGFYNTYRNNKIARIIAKLANWFILKTGKLGYYFAPFIFLKMSAKNEIYNK